MRRALLKHTRQEVVYSEDNTRLMPPRLPDDSEDMDRLTCSIPSITIDSFGMGNPWHGDKFLKAWTLQYVENEWWTQ
jgi:hypothetical protein